MSSIIGRKGVHYLSKLTASKVPADLIKKSQEIRVDASLSLIRETAKLKFYNKHNNCNFFPDEELNDPRVMTEVGDVPVQEIRDYGVDDNRLMGVITESVKLVMQEVGIRSINKEGREQGKRFGVNQYEMRTFSKDCQFLENLKLGEGVKGVYISIEVDCLDRAFAPGLSHIEPGGLSFRDVLYIINNLQGDVVVADVVEFNPLHDTVDRMTAMVAAKLVRELTAKMSK